jgi:DNA-directed RNA polymerase specialized sigma24 family protein
MAEPRDQAEAALARRRELRTGATERVLQLAQHLGESDRALIEQVYEHGQSLSKVAKATGVPASQLQRRLSRVLKRMRQPLFRFVAVRGDLLPREVSGTARRVVLQGMSLRETARRSGLTLHRVRKHMETVRAYYRLVGVDGRV